MNACGLAALGMLPDKNGTKALHDGTYQVNHTSGWNDAASKNDFDAYLLTVSGVAATGSNDNTPKFPIEGEIICKRA